MVLSTIGEVLAVPAEYVLVDKISNDGNRGSYFGVHSLSSFGNFIGPLFGGMELGAFCRQAMLMLFAMLAAGSGLLFAIGYASSPPASLHGQAIDASGGVAGEVLRRSDGQPSPNPVL